MEQIQGATLSLEHRYEVDERDAKIGFISRYQGRQLPFDRPVWIGVYDRLTDAAADPRVFERIKESAHRAHRIDAPGVLRILDYGTIDRGVPFVVSERIPSTTLADHLEEHGPLPPADLLPLLEGLADGLEAIHEAGLTHGNLTADWIHLEEGSPSKPHLSYFHVGLTLDELRRMDGAVLTPEIVRAYPPEAFARETPPAADLDEQDDPTAAFTPAADVWALGIVAYETLVGFHPFFDDDEPSDASEGIARLQKESARPLEDFGIESELSQVVSRALARDPAERFDSPTAFAEALRQALGQAPDRRTDPPDESTHSDHDTSPPEPADGEFEQPDEMADQQEHDDNVEPGGPASLLVTLVLVVLLASNLGWFLYYMQTPSNTQKADSTPQRLPPAESVRLATSPDGATVFDTDQTKLGKTPLTIPAKRLAESPLRLIIKKAGFQDHPVVLRRDGNTRTFSVQLRQSSGH